MSLNRHELCFGTVSRDFSRRSFRTGKYQRNLNVIFFSLHAPNNARHCSISFFLTRLPAFPIRNAVFSRCCYRFRTMVDCRGLGLLRTQRRSVIGEENVCLLNTLVPDRSRSIRLCRYPEWHRMAARKRHSKRGKSATNRTGESSLNIFPCSRCR